MKENFSLNSSTVKPESLTVEHESPEAIEKLQLDVVAQLKSYFDGSEIVTHQPSGKEIAHVYFANDDENSLKEAMVLLNLLDIIPWEDELRNELLIDSTWDIEKLILLGLLQPRMPADLPQESTDDGFLEKLRGFGSFPTLRIDRQKDAPQRQTLSETPLIDSEVTLPVDEYINRDYLDEPECTEFLVKAQNKYGRFNVEVQHLLTHRIPDTVSFRQVFCEAWS